MDDTDVRFHSGIPLGHKFFAILLALAVAGAGSAWLIYRSSQSASTAALAVNPTLAQQLDSGIASAQNPAVALADLMLNDQTVAKLAKQAHLASSTSAGQIGEFRSNLQLTESSAQRLDVRFQTADASQSRTVANAVAQALAAWNPASATAPPASMQSATPPATPVSQPAPADQGQPHPAAADADASQSTPPSPAPLDHPLSAALTSLGAQLSGTDQQLNQLAATGGEPSSYNESQQQSLLRSEVHEARSTLAGLHRQYAKELADPNISARLDEIRQALDSILPGGRRYGFNAAGVSGRELSAERSELRQAIRIVDKETQAVQVAEAAHPTPGAQPAAPATPPAPETTAAQSAPVSSSPAPAQSSPSPIQEQNLPPNAAVGQPQHPSQNPWSIVRLAAPAPRPPLWPAIVAGALCGLLYLGIAAFAYRRAGSDDIYPELRSAPQRMITPDDPVSLVDSHAPEPLHDKAAPRQRAAFVFQPAPPEDDGASVESPAAPAEKSLPLP
jgi:hypothetical protein